MTQRGRPRKYKWLTLHDLENQLSADAQYLKWASANNTALQAVAATGCPKCQSTNVELRHDQKYKIIRLHCTKCSHETSYRIKYPKPGSFEIVPILFDGVQIGETIIDHYHPATKRQRSDALIFKANSNVESGRTSLGGEWHIDKMLGGLHEQKRYYVSFEEITLMCSWNRMQVEHEKRLRELEEEVA